VGFVTDKGFVFVTFPFKEGTSFLAIDGTLEVDIGRDRIDDFSIEPVDDISTEDGRVDVFSVDGFRSDDISVEIGRVDDILAEAAGVGRTVDFSTDDV